MERRLSVAAKDMTLYQKLSITKQSYPFGDVSSEDHES
jgi:hypothetical protein